MSEARVPTPEQAAAIRASGSDLLLEAGAGTGKTGVMVERYCRLVCDERLAPDSILAFTFTDKAAAELRQRVRAELARRAAVGEERAQELLGEIGGAWITTIHGFCNRLLSAHPVTAGIDPGFRVLDAPEAERAARDAFDEALEEFLAEGDGSREQTAAAYGIDSLRAIVAGVHAELRSRGVADPRLPEPPQPDVAAALRRAAEAIAEALVEMKPDDAKREALERVAELCGGAEPPSLDELVSLRVSSKAQPLTACREAVEDAIARLAEAGEGGEAYRHIAALLELFSSRYEAAKEERAGVDFEDLQILAAGLLERAEIGESYRSRFRHLMVDEFQDTNRLQLRLVEALRGPQSELVVVGDELQSIYGFRHADLDVFREQRRLFAEREGAKAIALSGNFRSRPEVIGAVNAIGEGLFGDSFRPLRVGATPLDQNGGSGSPGGEPAVEMLLTARDGWDEEDIDLDPTVDGRTPLNYLAEARALAARLRELAEAGVPRGEMVVLLRAFTHLDAHEDSLERAGLRPYVVGGRGYWSQQQVGDVCALLAAIANPLDDQALFGALASPACGVAPDTLWLLRMAAGQRRRAWPALERAVGIGEAELEDPARLEAIPDSELALLRRFATTVEGLRERGTRLSLTGLVEAAVEETGYDLAVLMRPAGEARFANVRKLMRLAAEFESREGRDLRGLLDFLAARAESDTEGQAATAAEAHDGVRIMTVHNAKGLEFGTVAVPDLSRSPLAGSWAPQLTIGHEEQPRVGLKLRRLGAGAIDLYSYADLYEEEKRRSAEEELRLFHVAATRARERLILSGIVKPEPGSELKPNTPVIERIVDGLGVDRERDSTVAIAPPEPRAGLDASFEASEIAVRVNLPSPARAAELRLRGAASDAARPLGNGPAPLVEREAPAVPRRPLSYSAISAYKDCSYRFYMERVLGLGDKWRGGEAEEATATPSAREERAARGVAIHALLEWSQANGWAKPSPELAHEHAEAVDLDSEGAESLLGPVRGWLESDLFRERVASAGGATQAEVPILLGIAGTVLRGSIDLLVEREGAAPLVVDYKTDRLEGSTPAERAERYETQRAIYALAVAESRGTEEVEVAYVFLERPEEPVVSRLSQEETEAARAVLASMVEDIGRGAFEPTPAERRSWALCKGCPALGRMCSGPLEKSEPAAAGGS
jgi:ATP-dependent exoDNAse (exonuclease V) beta subunit